MKFLNSDGLRTVLSKIKDKFATKEQLQELEKKSGGGYEEVVVKVLNNNKRYYFKLIKIGRRVDVYQIHDTSNAVDVLPTSFEANEQTCLGTIYNSEDSSGLKYFESKYNNRGLVIDDTLGVTEEKDYIYGNDTYTLTFYLYRKDLKQIYIGSYITKEWRNEIFNR